ncbi:MAG: hypothetical protein GXY10_07200 [Clostridiales bacterium]|nr:hypothetical protein [Clostridiales bacterium]
MGKFNKLYSSGVLGTCSVRDFYRLKKKIVNALAGHQWVSIDTEKADKFLILVQYLSWRSLTNYFYVSGKEISISQ